MERVINLLYDIEEKADQIVKRANQEKVKLYDKLQKDLELLDQDISVLNTEKLKVLKAQVDEELTTEKQSLIDDCNKQLVNLEENYLHNNTSLVNKILQEIIHS